MPAEQSPVLSYSSTQSKMLCIQVTKGMISAWDCPITEMNNGSLPENTYWLLAVNFTMDNAEVTILQMRVNWSCCCLILAGWFAARDKTRQEKCLHPVQAGRSPANFPSWIIWSSHLRSQFMAHKEQNDCLHLTKIKTPPCSLILCRTEFFKDHPIIPGPNSLSLWWLSPPRTYSLSACCEWHYMESSTYTRCHRLSPDQTKLYPSS